MVGASLLPTEGLGWSAQHYGTERVRARLRTQPYSRGWSHCRLPWGLHRYLPLLIVLSCTGWTCYPCYSALANYLPCRLCSFSSLPAATRWYRWPWRSCSSCILRRTRGCTPHRCTSLWGPRSLSALPQLWDSKFG